MKRYFILPLLLSVLITIRVAAQVPQYISYQGNLADKSGAPVPDGTHTVGVTFFATGDTASQPFANFSIPAVQTVKGVFNVMIQITDSKLFSRPLFMGVKVDNSGFIGQPSPVSAAPYSLYAMEAWHARQSDSSTFSQRALRATVADSIKGGIATITRQSIGAAASGANNDITSLNGLTNPFAILQGGTGATTASAARANLGAAGSGVNSDITSLTGLTTALPLSEGGTAATNAAGARTNLGLGNLATQGSNAVSISGGTIEGTAIGMIAPALGSFTTLQYSGNVFTLGNETDNATGLNTVNISGSVPIAIVQTGTANGPITANVAGGLPGQWLYIVNRATFTVTFAATAINTNAAAQFLNANGVWIHMQ